ncbi:hypothetical protein BDP27DRAFT_1365074 [Rhodocollybia butyracea]|uniref:S5 DRBM domain-containing protein n=1 Tax=Rhodocollybia butyracea TaxID=206335 RepID=A0A9P5U6V3_9AGAR|nr:hypothetical protein BDP27DRAFT_1365074 [Rhodocollybia butyracea]
MSTKLISAKLLKVVSTNLMPDLTLVQPDILFKLVRSAKVVPKAKVKTPYVFPIIGGRKIENLVDNLEALDITLNDEQIKELESVVPFNAGFPSDFVSSNLHLDIILSRRIISQQTGKGKIKHYQVFAVVGDGGGLVGMGMSTRSKYPLLRPRPAGIKDISAKVRGSRNPVMIMQGTLKMLHGGWNPLGLGDGIEGKGKRQEKGVGMRGKDVLKRGKGRRVGRK